MYADDTEIDSVSKPDYPEELENNLNSDLCKISEYFNINRLNLNVPKCEFMLIGTYQSLAKINNEPLHKVTISKYLGMFIDSNIKWDDHINDMIPKISAKIGILRSLRNIVLTDTLKQIYNAIVHLHLDYGDAVYDSASQTSKYRLQKLQTRTVRLIMGSGPHTSRNLMFNKLKWLSLQQKRDFYKCILVFKCRMGLAPQYLCDMFIANNSNHSNNTRNATQLRATITRTAYYYRSFTVSGLNLWNCLPNHIKECTSLSSFKRSLYNHMVTKAQF